jgi:glutamyl-tRNA(Gln) amidotransferase subunit E
LRREGVNVEAVADRQFIDLFSLVGSGKTAKEAIPGIITWLSKHEGATAKDALESLGLAMISQWELEQMIDDLMKQNEVLVRERGVDALGLLMGVIMKKVRGRVKAELVSEVLRRRLETFAE